MSYHRFFLDEQILSNETEERFVLELSKEDAKHARVLRLKEHERIAVIDAAGDYFICEIVGLDDGIHVRISQRLDVPTEPFELTLFQGLARSERFEAVLRHATELGVHAFVPLSSRRCVVQLDGKKLASKLNRWETIVKNAAKQAGLSFIAKVASPIDVDLASSSMLGSFDLVLICWEESLHAPSIRQAIASSSIPDGASVAVVVGPEGGFEEDEVSSMLAANPASQLVGLGPSILRTETAGIVSCAFALDALRERFSS